MEELPRSRQLAAKVLFQSFKILKDAGGQLPGREVLKRIEQTAKFDEWEQERYSKTGNIRWQSILHFFTIDAIKAGFLRKQKGVWILTPEGENAINLGAVKLLQTASNAYKEWNIKNKKIKTEEKDIPVDKEEEQETNLELLEEQARNGLSEYINNLNPYEFQDLVAALLHAMGYYIAWVAPRGKDNGIDILAYQDPLGTKTPRIKVQVKHKPNTSVPSSDVRNLIGTLSKDSEIGLFVTSGSFTTDARDQIRNSHTHIEMIDFERFISLWQEYYTKLTDDEKNLLPLRPIFFLDSTD